MFQFLRSLFGHPPEPDLPPVPWPDDPAVTLFDEPRRADGSVNYEAALNTHLRGTLDPGDNALTLLMGAVGPKPEGVELPPSFFRWLGTDPPPVTGNFLTPLNTFFAGTATVEVEQQLRTLATGPWSSADHPPFTAWLRANEKPMAVAMEASRRPAYFQPWVSEDGTGGLLLSRTLSTVPAAVRQLALLFCLRSMLCGEECWKDLFAAFRLGRLLSLGGSLFELLVGLAVEFVATDSLLALLVGQQLSREGLRSLRERYASLPAAGTFESKLAVCERVLALDFLQVFHRDGLRAVERLTGHLGLRRPMAADDAAVRQAVDWSTLAAGYGLHFNRMAVAHTQSSHAERVFAWNAVSSGRRPDLVERFQRWKIALRRVRTVAHRAEYTRHLAHCLRDPSIIQLHQLSDATHRGRQLRRNVQVAFALAEHHADTGTYPERLADLVPAYLDAVPDDVFADRPLVYRRTKTGYRFHSVGANGKEDAGGNDDLGVSMPRKK